MSKFLSILFISFFYFFTLHANSNLKNIVIEGNNRVSNETIKVYSGVDLKQPIDESTINQILKNLYETDFFEDVKVELDGQILKISVKEYPVINQLIFVGETNNKIKKELKKIVSLKEKKSLNRSKIAKDLDLIKNLYSSLGYNFSEVEVKIKEIDTNNFDLIFEISKGEQTKISSISFTGNKKVKDKRLKDIIASEEDKFWKVLSRNTKFNQSLIDLDLRLLNSIDISLLGKS